MKSKQVVVIGGGTGTAVVISALHRLPYVNVSAIVSVADSGGSTGRLRDEFGFQPVGDLRQALAALASRKEQQIIRNLLLYRFSKGSGIEGHNVGNLILTALQDLTGSTAKAIETASSIFRLKGNIYPVTTKKVDLVVEYDDGSFVIGEHHLNPHESGGKKIKRVRLSPHAKVYGKAREALLKADFIIIGPGDVYASLMPNLIVSGMKATLTAVKAPIAYVVNLMTSYTQTHNMSAREHVAVIEKAMGHTLTHILVHSGKIPQAIVAAYAAEHDVPVINDLQGDSRLIQANLATTRMVNPQPGDTIVRSFLRHDPKKLIKVLTPLL